jgi:hypothetical protein
VSEISARFAFFAVMSVIDLLKTDREAHEAREGFYDRCLGELRVLCGRLVIELLKSYREAHEDREGFYRSSSR